jgi:predicted GNAT family acetyltransferase
LRFVLTRDPEQVAAQALEFVAGAIERNVHATVLMNAVEQGSEGLYCYGLDADGAVAYVGLRTPPWPLLTSELAPPLAGELVQAWLREDPECNGVSGLPGSARAIANAWASLTGGTTRVRMSNAMFALSWVRDPPRPASGSLRVAGAADRELLLEWGTAFFNEAAVGRGEIEGQRMVQARLPRGELLLWEDGGPVSFLGMTAPVSRVVRIGPVYTPPGHRRRGYAGSAVAAASRRALAAGADRCMLFTDLANPTSNKIYAEVGYERFGDWEEHEFLPATA